MTVVVGNVSKRNKSYCKSSSSKPSPRKSRLRVNVGIMLQRSMHQRIGNHHLVGRVLVILWVTLLYLWDYPTRPPICIRKETSLNDTRSIENISTIEGSHTYWSPHHIRLQDFLFFKEFLTSSQNFLSKKLTRRSNFHSPKCALFKYWFL